ncbi:FMN-binding protein [Angustibacter sp. McL0619]|uniref:FMN-binding protein n=1 Tax=Angustibacter sp. McL0619 TaxID=3415676 RepID=UPI003CEC7ABB
MRRIVFVLMSTVTALVLLFSYHTSTSSQIAPSTSIASGVGSSGGTAAGGSSSSSGSGTSGSGTSSSGTTYTGDAVDTQWGVVQVAITVDGGKITAAEAVRYPTGNGRDQEINSYAVPQLNSEAVQGQTGSIDAVSGATVTSDGYIQSLQSAIDKANL